MNRAERIAGELHALLSELIRKEIKDPRVGFVSITSVDVTNDLSLARVYFLPLGGEGDVVAMRKGLAKAEGFLRHRLRKRLRIRQIPDLRFIVDEGHEQAVNLIRELTDLERDRQDAEEE